MGVESQETSKHAQGYATSALWIRTFRTTTLSVDEKVVSCILYFQGLWWCLPHQKCLMHGLLLGLVFLPLEIHSWGLEINSLLNIYALEKMKTLRARVAFQGLHDSFLTVHFERLEQKVKEIVQIKEETKICLPMPSISAGPKPCHPWRPNRTSCCSSPWRRPHVTVGRVCYLPYPLVT